MNGSRDHRGWETESGDGSAPGARRRPLSSDSTYSCSSAAATHGLRASRTGYDLAGMWTSLACALHCLFLVLGPLVLALPGNGFLYTASVRWMAISLAGFLVVRSLRSAAGTQDRTAIAMVWGLFLLICGRVVESCAALGWPIGEFLAVLGGLVLAGAHGLRFVHPRPRRPIAPLESGVRSRAVSVVHVAKALFWTSLAATAMTLTLDPRSRPIDSVERGGFWSGRPQVGWDLLAQLETGSGAAYDISPALAAVVGAEVSIPGYAVPLDEHGRQFLLAPWLGACIHAPTPPPNQLIHVQLEPGAEPIDPWSLSPLWVVGRLEVVETESPYGAVSYRLRATATSDYERTEPLQPD